MPGYWHKDTTGETYRERIFFFNWLKKWAMSPMTHEIFSLLSDVYKSINACTFAIQCKKFVGTWQYHVERSYIGLVAIHPTTRFCTSSAFQSRVPVKSHTAPIWTSRNQQVSCLASTMGVAEFPIRVGTVRFQSIRVQNRQIVKWWSRVAISLWTCLVGFGIKFVQLNNKSNEFGRIRIFERSMWLVSAYSE